MYKNKKIIVDRKTVLVFMYTLIFSSFITKATMVDIIGKQPPKFSLSAAAKAEMTPQEITAFEKSYQGVITNNTGSEQSPDEYEVQKMLVPVIDMHVDSLSLWLSMIENPFYVVRKQIEHEYGFKNKKFIPKEHKALLLKVDRYDACVKNLGLMMGVLQNSFYVNTHEKPISSKQEIMKHKAYSVGVEYPFTAEERNNEQRVGQLLLEIAWQHQAPDPDSQLVNKAEADFINQCLTIPLNNFFYEDYFEELE